MSDVFKHSEKTTLGLLTFHKSCDHCATISDIFHMAYIRTQGLQFFNMIFKKNSIPVSRTNFEIRIQLMKWQQLI